MKPFNPQPGHFPCIRLEVQGCLVVMSLDKRNALHETRGLGESIMKQLVSAVIAASILILPAVSFAAQADGPRALDRIVQQNEKYERDHPRQSPTAHGERKAADKSMGESPSSADSH
jgi:hypothetical protein